MVNGFKVITLCGSTRFKKEFLETQKRLTLEGNIVVSVGLFGHSGDNEVRTEGVKDMLDCQHLAKIDMADEIFVINAGGYVGESTRREIAYAAFKGKTIAYLESCRKPNIYDNYAALGELHDARRISDEDYEKAGHDFDEKRKVAIAEYNACKGPWPYQWRNIDAVVCGILQQHGIASIDYHDLEYLYDSYCVWELRVADKSTDKSESTERICQLLRNNYEHILRNAQKLVVTLKYSSDSHTIINEAMRPLQDFLNELKPNVTIIWQIIKSVEAMNNLEISIIIKHQYDDWVNKVRQFLSEVGPQLGEKGTHCATFQSKPILDKRPDVVFLGYNPHESWEFYKEDTLPERFYEGNNSFYSEERKNKKIWRVWRYEDAFLWANYCTPIEDGKFVFFNAVYFGTNDIREFEKIKGSKEAVDKCHEYTKEVILNVFKPKCIVCFSVEDCFDRLNMKFHFQQVKTVKTAEETEQEILDEVLSTKKWNHIHNCTKTVKHALWNDIPIYGIPHPSGSISHDDFGAIALYLKSEMQKLSI